MGRGHRRIQCRQSDRGRRQRTYSAGESEGSEHTAREHARVTSPRRMELIMQQNQLPDDPVNKDDDELHIETPVIDIQDVAHKPSPETRVSNKGVKIEPKMDSEDARDLAR